MTIEEATRKVIGLAEAGDHRFLDLAAQLRALHDALAEDRDGASLDVFENTLRKAGISRRKAYYLIDIDRTYGRQRPLRKRLASVGWTKLGLMAKHVGQRDLAKWLQIAEDSTVEELKAKLARKEPSGRAMLFRLSEHEADLVTGALLLNGASYAGKRLGGRRRLLNKESALVALCKSLKPGKRSSGR